jgi:ribosome-associated protein
VQGSLDDDQAEELVVVDLRGKSNMADALVIASARNPRHMRAMADHLKQRLKEAGAPAPPIEGLEQCIWVLVDAGDVIVHLFRPEMRRIYNLEKMWGAQLPEPKGSSSRSAPEGGA